MSIVTAPPTFPDPNGAGGDRAPAPAPLDAETTRRQDQAFSPGGWFGGNNLTGANADGFYSAVAPLRGSGTFDGTNPYSPNTDYAGSVGGVGMGTLFGQTVPGTYHNYRVMSSHPTLVLAMASVMCPIVAAGWSIEADDDAPKEAQEFIEEELLPRRFALLRDYLRALVYGYAGFELVWEVRPDGFARIRKHKYLLPDLTTILVSGNGDWLGFRQGDVDVPAAKASLFTYDREGDNHYGRSRHENARRVWANYLSVEDQLFKLGRKTSGIIPRVGYPPPSPADVNAGKVGVLSPNYLQARAIATGMEEGRPVVFPNMVGLELDDVARLPELAKQSLWSMEIMEAGNTGPAIGGMIEQLRYYDALLCRAWLRPERSVIEATQSGSRADSESHGGVGTADCDQVHMAVVEAINANLTDPMLVENFGEKCRGCVRIVPMPLVDEKRIIFEKVLDGLVRTPQGLAELFANIDGEELIDRLGLPKAEQPAGWEGLEVPDAAAAGAEPDGDEGAMASADRAK